MSYANTRILREINGKVYHKSSVDEISDYLQGLNNVIIAIYPSNSMIVTENDKLFLQIKESNQTKRYLIRYSFIRNEPS